MTIPTRLQKRLSENSALQGAVQLALERFAEWFEDSKMPFFPEYTEHGVNHLANTLSTADWLITDESWKIITPEDAAVLVLSVGLHDCAMHLSPDGFVRLVDPRSNFGCDKNDASDVIDVTFFDDLPWSELWVAFLAEATRFDSRKLKLLFDNTEPIRKPPVDPLEMTSRDKLLIGEFLRRHHTRLSHEIALWGVPGPHEERLRFGELPRDIAYLAGLVARSHGMSLRRALEAVPRENRRVCLKTHLPFLMAVLRVSDFLQVDSSRAPDIVAKVRSIRSPLSQGEWSAHQAVKEVHSFDDDPEALFVMVKPDNVRDYLRIKKLLIGLQQELDASWAVLGESYGRVEFLKELGLTVRRIRSNLDDYEKFSQTVNYYPDSVQFDADPEILKLLIHPLYGDEPAIGIRELVQNAVDACNELEDYNVSVAPSSSATASRVTIEVHLLEDEALIVVEDNGIGMTFNTIKNYFLKAGASFRRSDAWREIHEDIDGKSRVLRSGRFGIGVLAAFLLGNELEVQTRHVTEPPDRGVRFRCSIEDDSIELDRVELPTVGTTIRIRLNKSAIEGLRDKNKRWDWYHLVSPSVLRRKTDKNLLTGVIQTREIGNTYLLPEPGIPDLPEGWHRVNHEDFHDIHWTYPERERTLERQSWSGSLFCNGIVIGSSAEYGGSRNLVKSVRYAGWPYPLEVPLISAFDPNGKLPLNLARTDLARDLPFAGEILNEVYRDLIAYVHATAPEEPPSNTKTLEQFTSMGYIGLRRGYNRTQFFWTTPHGVSFPCRWFLQQVSPTTLHFVPSLSAYQFQIPKECAYIVPSRVNPTFGEIDHWVRSVLEHGPASPFEMDNSDSYWVPKGVWLDGVKTIGRRILVSTEYARRMMEDKPRNLPKFLIQRLEEEWSDARWTILATHDCPKSVVDLRSMVQRKNVRGMAVFAEWHIESISTTTEEHRLVEVWKELMSGSVIPYAKEERATLWRGPRNH